MKRWPPAVKGTRWPRPSSTGFARSLPDARAIADELTAGAFSAVVDALQTPGGDRVECAPWLKTALLRQMRPSPPSGRSCSAAKGRPSPWEERPRCSANPLSPPLSVQENSGGPLASPRMGSERNRHSETLLAFATTPMAARRHEYPEQLRWLGRRCPSSPALARISRGSSRR